jgi:hypothetical protein
VNKDFWIELLGLVAFGLLLVALLRAQAPKLPECHGTRDKDHPCNCLQHTRSVQQAAYVLCEHMSGKAQRDCEADIPMHCDLIERYGNWHTNEAGEHDSAMPGQCRSACVRAHCKCDSIFDGSVCHIAHDPKNDPK